MAEDGHPPSTLYVDGCPESWIGTGNAVDDEPAAGPTADEPVGYDETSAPTAAGDEPDAMLVPAPHIIDVTPPPAGAARPRRGRRRAPHQGMRRPTKAVVAAIVTGVVAAGTPVLLRLGSESSTPNYVQPAPIAPRPEPEPDRTTPGGNGPSATPSGRPAPAMASATATGPGQGPPAQPGPTPPPASGDPNDPGDPTAVLPPQPPPPVNPEPVNLSSEAESHQVSGNTRPRGNSAASGGTVVGWVGNGSSNTLRLTVTVPDTNTYNVTLFYISAGARQAVISVNDGGDTTTDFPPTGDWSTVKSVTLALALRAGANTIKLGNPNAYGPDFDRIVVTR